MPRFSILSSCNKFQEGDEPSLGTVSASGRLQFAPRPGLSPGSEAAALVPHGTSTPDDLLRGLVQASELPWPHKPLTSQSTSASHHEQARPGEAARVPHPRAVGLKAPCLRLLPGLQAQVGPVGAGFSGCLTEEHLHSPHVPK